MDEQQGASAPVGAGMVLLQLSLGRFGNSRQGSLEQVDTEADKSMLRLSKVLLDSPELAATVTLDGQVLKWLGLRSVPSFFKRGVYSVKPGAVPEIEAQLRQFRQLREAAVEAFGQVYEAQAEAARGRLRDQFNPADYPPVGKVKRCFTMDWKYLQVAVPGALRGVAPELFEEQAKKLMEEMDSARQMGLALVRGQMKELVDHFVERLTPGEDGKRKVFKGASLENLREFVLTFPFRDMADDSALQAEVRKLSGLLEGVDPAALRSNETLREAIGRGFGQMKERLDGLVEAAPLRRVRWGEEDAA